MLNLSGSTHRVKPSSITQLLTRCPNKFKIKTIRNLGRPANRGLRCTQPPPITLFTIYRMVNWSLNMRLESICSKWWCLLERKQLLRELIKKIWLEACRLLGNQTGRSNWNYKCTSRVSPGFAWVLIRVCCSQRDMMALLLNCRSQIGVEPSESQLSNKCLRQ